VVEKNPESEHEGSKGMKDKQKGRGGASSLPVLRSQPRIHFATFAFLVFKELRSPNTKVVKE